MTKTYDVIISGAGPVGLFLACELALAKCSVLVLEKTFASGSPLKQLPFGIRGLSAPTIESLDRRGLLNELEIHKRIKNPHKNPAQGAQRQVGHFAGIPFLEGDVELTRWKNRLPSSTAVSLISEMEELETILARRAESAGVDIKRGQGVTAFKQNELGIFVETCANVYQAKYLVGCDGARSVVRKLGGFEFAGTEPEFTGYTTKIEMADPEKLKPGRILTAKGMYLQSQPGYVVIQDFDGGAFHASEKPITREHVQDVLRRISETDVTITALHIATTWTDRARQVTAYRKGRILLAGDAAHIHSPLGGQGLNLGIGDAMNLGWKLAAMLHGHAPAGLLDSYQAERHLIGEQVLDWSRAQVALMRPGTTARALNSVVRDLMATRDGATYFAARVWGVFMHYDLGDENEFVGASVPNFEFENGKTASELLRGGKGLLIDFKDQKSLEKIAGNFANQLTYLSLAAKEQLGLNALLVRPDGVIAWVAKDALSETALSASLKRWFCES